MTKNQSTKTELRSGEQLRKANQLNAKAPANQERATIAEPFSSDLRITRALLTIALGPPTMEWRGVPNDETHVAPDANRPPDFRSPTLFAFNHRSPRLPPP